jgi:hypothetical protein
MDIVFRDLLFNINDGRIGLRRFFGMDFGKSCPFAEVQIAGRNKQSDMGIKAVLSSERDRDSIKLKLPRCLAIWQMPMLSWRLPSMPM